VCVVCVCVVRVMSRLGRCNRGALCPLSCRFSGVPLYAVLAFTLGEGVSGFWEARVALMIVVLLIVLSMLLATSWTHEAGRAQVHNFAPEPVLEKHGSSSSGFVRL